MTLVESAMVIGVISLVILGALLALESVTEQRRLTQAATDAAMIRSAVSRWAAGGLLTYPDLTTGTVTSAAATELTSWSQLAGLLPGHLKLVAAGATNLTVSNVNPWSSDYVIHLIADGSAKWTLDIGAVPSSLADLLGKQLELNGGDATGTNLSGASIGGLTDCSPSGTAIGTVAQTVCVSYEE